MRPLLFIFFFLASLYALNAKEVGLGAAGLAGAGFLFFKIRHRVQKCKKQKTIHACEQTRFCKWQKDKCRFSILKWKKKQTQKIDVDEGAVEKSIKSDIQSSNVQKLTTAVIQSKVPIDLIYLQLLKSVKKESNALIPNLYCDPSDQDTATDPAFHYIENYQKIGSGYDGVVYGVKDENIVIKVSSLLDYYSNFRENTLVEIYGLLKSFYLQQNGYSDFFLSPIDLYLSHALSHDQKCLDANSKCTKEISKKERNKLRMHFVLPRLQMFEKGQEWNHDEKMRFLFEMTWGDLQLGKIFQTRISDIKLEQYGYHQIEKTRIYQLNDDLAFKFPPGFSMQRFDLAAQYPTNRFDYPYYNDAIYFWKKTFKVSQSMEQLEPESFYQIYFEKWRVGKKEVKQCELDDDCELFKDYKGIDPVQTFPNQEDKKYPVPEDLKDASL